MISVETRHPKLRAVTNFEKQWYQKTKTNIHRVVMQVVKNQNVKMQTKETPQRSELLIM
jgi:hypothetical protein